MQNITLDISCRRLVEPVDAKQGEVGRKFRARIVDNGVPYAIPDTALLSVWYSSATDEGCYSTIGEKSAFTIDGNVVDVEIIAQMLFKPGNGEMCLTITDADGSEISTWNIPYHVERKPGAGSAVATEYYTALTEAGALAVDGATRAEAAAAQAEQSRDLVIEAMDRMMPIGYYFYWSPVDGQSNDLSTPESVTAFMGFGVWERVDGVFLGGYDIGGGEINSTGGRDVVRLTVENMPRHAHEMPVLRGGSSTKDTAAGTDYGFVMEYTEPAGEDMPFEILPPYRVVYIWQRIG